MLEHRYRFHGHNSLKTALRQGKTVRTGNLTLRFITNPARLHSRVAVIVAKKVVKSAPKRNRIRRRLFEAIRLHNSLIQSGCDLVFIVNTPSPLLITSSELTREIDSLARASRIKGPVQINQNQSALDAK